MNLQVNFQFTFGWMVEDHRYTLVYSGGLNSLLFNSRYLREDKPQGSLRGPLQLQRLHHGGQSGLSHTV
jgi:hypothetical protein